MNKIRGQKKDVTRTLKAMKLEQSTRYHDTLADRSSASHEYRRLAKPIYSSSKKDAAMAKPTKKRSLRYQHIATEADSQPRSFSWKHNTLDVRTSNYLRISQKGPIAEPLPRNPYLSNSRLNSAPRHHPYHPRRMLTHEDHHREPERRHVHLKTLNTFHAPGVQEFLSEARTLLNNGSLEESESILQRVLREEPENKEALYLCGLSNFKQMNYNKALITLNKLLEMDHMCNKNAYVMSSICYSKKGMQQQAMDRIDACLSCYDDYYEAHFQKAKLYIKLNKLDQAIKSLKKALKLAKDPYECCLKLGECYEKTSLFDLAIKLYDHIIKQGIVAQDNQSRYACYLKKAECEKRLDKYQDYVETLKQYLSIVDKNTVINSAQIYYQIGYGYYKLHDYANAVMNLQQVLTQKTKAEVTKALILLTLINIKKRDFYQAYHNLLRKQHLEIVAEDIEYYEKFCEGVLCLMKRKFQLGLEKLLEIQFEATDSPKNEQQLQITKIYPLYLSYAYFCLGKTEKCIKINKKLLAEKEEAIRAYRRGIEFNLALCEGLEQYRHKRIPEARIFFEKSIEIYPQKPEGYLYLGMTLIELYLKTYNQNLIKRAKSALTSCVQNLKQLNNNYASSAFYVKAALSAFMGEWNNAISQIDQSIERAEDNDHKSFYLRALILACCQNFKQAIGEVSIAISLHEKQPNYYLLRSKCQQIEGDGNRAFQDLQEYIAICPDDTEIHKYAGHLLFENGAFEDAIQAYQNGELTVETSNFDVFLTRAKTYFLLGDFQKAFNDFQAASKIKPSDVNLSFDVSIVGVLRGFFDQKKQPIIMTERAQKAKQELQNIAASGQLSDYGRIFKKIEIAMLSAMFLFYMGQYKEAVRQFKQTISMKHINFSNNESSLEEDVKEKQFFISEMNYNRAVCYLMMNESVAAVKAMQLCNLQPNSKTHVRLTELVAALRGKASESKSIEVFAQKNKMSKLLNELQITTSNGKVMSIRLCIPFPKVEPPQINPKFEIRILRQLDVMAIERKPEAPWILREENSIKFTQKIQQFSRLEINNSELSKPDKSARLEAQNQSSQSIVESEFGQSSESLARLRDKLKLDDKIEHRLNKLLKQQK